MPILDDLGFLKRLLLAFNVKRLKLREVYGYLPQSVFPLQGYVTDKYGVVWCIGI